MKNLRRFLMSLMLVIMTSGCTRVNHVPPDAFSLHKLEKGQVAPFSGVLVGEELYIDIMLKLREAENRE